MCGLTRFYCCRDEEFQLVEVDESELLPAVLELKREGWEIEHVVAL